MTVIIGPVVCAFKNATSPETDYRTKPNLGAYGDPVRLAAGGQLLRSPARPAVSASRLALAELSTSASRTALFPNVLGAGAGRLARARGPTRRLRGGRHGDEGGEERHVEAAEGADGPLDQNRRLPGLGRGHAARFERHGPLRRAAVK